MNLEKYFLTFEGKRQPTKAKYEPMMESNTKDISETLDSDKPEPEYGLIKKTQA